MLWLPHGGGHRLFPTICSVGRCFCHRHCGWAEAALMSAASANPSTFVGGAVAEATLMRPIRAYSPE